MIHPFQRLILALTLALLAPGAWAQTVVLNTNDSGTGSLRYAISNAPAGTTITFTNTLSGATILLTNGELLLNQNLTIDASTLTNGIIINGNHASRIFEVTNATVTLNSLTITNGYVTTPNLGGGGGILNDSGAMLTVSNCIVSGNTAAGFGNGTAIGGGINNSGTMMLNQSTLSGNNATSGNGGGIFQGNGTLTLNQSTLSGNNATRGYGGGICQFSGSMTLNQNTLSGNIAGLDGGGIYNSSLEYITNSIVAGNTAPLPGMDIHNNAQLQFGGSNIVQTINGAVTGTYITNAPLLAPLGNYGGPTQTMPPLPGSPAINGCTNTLFTVDQRGYPRTNGLSDIGAVQGVFNPAIPISNPSASFVGGIIASFQFAFTNLSGPSYTVFATTNLVLPFSQWANLGPAVESPVGSGQFQFTDPQAATNAQRFYRVVAP